MAKPTPSSVTPEVLPKKPATVRAAFDTSSYGATEEGGQLVGRTGGVTGTHLGPERRHPIRSAEIVGDHADGEATVASLLRGNVQAA